MKKIKMILCLVLALAMVLSLAACGNKKDDDVQQASNDKPGKTEQTETPDFVYTLSSQKLDSGEDIYLNPQVFTDDGFYASSYEKTGVRELREGETLEYEGQLDIYSTRLYFVPLDGKTRLLGGYEPLPAPEDTLGRTGYGSGTDLEVLVRGKDGKLIAIERVYENWFNGTEEEMNSDDHYDQWKYESTAYIRVLNDDGSEISSSKIDYIPGPNESAPSFYNTTVDEKGNVIGFADMRLLAVATDGAVEYVLEGDEYIDSLIKLRDGSIAVGRWGDNGMELVPVDIEKGSFGESIPMPADAYTFIPGSGDYDLYYRSGSGLYGYRFDTKESEKLLNFINCDVNADYLNGVRVADDGTVTGVLTNWRGETTEMEYVKLSRVPADSVPKKESLTLAVLWMDSDLSDKVIDFNRHSDDVRIEIADYSEFNTEEDWSAGQTKLLTEILSGSMPDLFVLQQLPYDQLAAKGLLADLYPYLDADPELKREDFFPTVLSAMENNGKLCRICPSFSIMTLMGAASVVGDKPGWTYDQFMAALATMPEGCTPLDESMTRSDILQLLVYLDMEDFVDWNTGKCSFDSQEFIDLLEFANMFQAEFDWDADFDWSTWESSEQRIAAGKQMCMSTSIYSVDSVMYNDFYFGGDATYIGWPTNSGVGNMLNLSDQAFGMSADCANKEAGWKFLRTLLTEDYQKGIWSLPVNVHAFEQKLKEAMTPEYIKDENGNILLDENGEKQMASKGGVGMADGTVHYIYAMTQEQADKLTDLINNTTRSMDYNESIYNIVTEQAEAYFQGQKSAEEVARLVQSKANIYVNEQR